MRPTRAWFPVLPSPVAAKLAALSLVALPLLPLALASPAQADPLLTDPPLTFEAALAARLPSREESASELMLAEARRAAAGEGGLALEAPTLAVAGGPRREAGGEATGDLSVELAVPLLARRAERAALGRELAAHGGALAAGAAALATSDLAVAFVDAWLAQQRVRVREQDLATAEEWLAVARLRVEAGADPPYEPILVAGERERVLVELVAARREVELAWGELAARSAVGPQPRPLSLAGLPEASSGAGAPHQATAGEAPARATPGAVSQVPVSQVPVSQVPVPQVPVRQGPAAAAIAAHRWLALALARVRFAATRSRWALASEVAAEGEERLAHLGLAYRFSLRGERAAAAGELATAEAEAAREAERATAALRARLAAAGAAFAVAPSGIDDGELQRALDALAVRLAEGKERASQVLPLRRQLLEARLAALASQAARARAAAELHFLLGGLPDAP